MTKSNTALENGYGSLDEIDARLQKLNQQLDGVTGAVSRCAGEAGFNEARRQQRQATSDYFMYFFGPAPRVGP